MRRYETILIAHVDLSEDELSNLIARYGGIVTGQKGILVKVERWGKRRLAYLIKKQMRGFYILIDYAGVSAVVNELERNLKIDDKILKYMTVLKAETVDIEALEKEIAEATGTGREKGVLPRRRCGRNRRSRYCRCPACGSERNHREGGKGFMITTPTSAPRGPKGPRPQKKFFHRRKFCRFCTDSALKIEYKDSQTLRDFTTERGKIMPRRITGNCAKHQRELTVAIKRARTIALLPFVVSEG